MFASKTGKNPNTGIINTNVPIYSTARNTNFTFDKSGTTPDGYDFIEDMNRFDSTNSYYRLWYGQ